MDQENLKTTLTSEVGKILRDHGFVWKDLHPQCWERHQGCGLQRVMLDINWKKRSWRVGLDVRQVFTRGECRVFLRTSPFLLNPLYPVRWVVTTGLDLQRTLQAWNAGVLDEVLDFYRQVESPEGAINHLIRQPRRTMHNRILGAFHTAWLLTPFFEGEDQAQIHTKIMSRLEQLLEDQPDRLENWLKHFAELSNLLEPPEGPQEMTPDRNQEQQDG
ncbi:hypothetical protein [Deinococcus misasensis]|uniref:hypothetical protein n=1 Tax=Deinococcus misasensis TaxID=392413 RepID=UPI0005507AF1|nr:hypothetical protein [Deinococcus misasensis]